MKLIMMVGIPGSGKSSSAERVAIKENAIVVSTDAIRNQLFGDESIQLKPYLVFKTLYETIDKLLSENKNVIVDATNAKRHRRINLLKKYKDVYKECYYIDTPLDICIERDNKRKRHVGKDVILKIYKDLEIPLVGEGFNEVHIIHEKSEYPISKDEFINLINRYPDYDELFTSLKDIKLFSDMYKFNQENPYHKYLLCEHTYNAFQYITEFYNDKDKLLLLIVAILHDTGKPICKKFKKIKDYYTYYGHELVSSQLACHFLKELGFDDDFITNVISLIELHMLIHFGTQEDLSMIYRLLGEDLLSKLYIFKEADTFAK